MKTRLYAVKVVVGAEQRDHLVDATSQATAKKHVASKYVEAEVANGKDVAALMAKGVKPETASEEVAPTQQSIPA